jgi:hypothetical protein
VGKERMVLTEWEKVKEDVLVACKRYCCYCEEYKGRDIEVHHIIQRANGGKDSFDNAIPLCFDCHSEIGSYNPNHPKGNSFKTGELKRIRDDFYLKAEKLVRNPKEYSDKDKLLLEEFKNESTDIIEYIIRTDFSCELIDINLSDKLDNLVIAKLSRKKFGFENENLEQIKMDIIDLISELKYYISDEFLRYHEGSGMLIFKNQSWEEGCKLRDVLRPNTIRIRSEMKKQLEYLYSE